ncbi:MAG: PEGA domain-containing protein, partial [Myxococcaceae bacterium]|nr:PEGA domain-containing protein [Myxococcaceae bacterium]
AWETWKAFRMALEEWMLAERQPGTAAHLSAYMKDLYAERLAEERAAGKPFADNEKTPSQLFRRSVVDRSGQSRLSQVRSASTRSQIAIANTGDDGGATVAAKPDQLPSAAPEPKKSPVPLIAGAAIALVLLGAIGVFLATRSGGETERTTPAAAAMSGTLNLLTDPKGAQVLIDGELLDERTPLQGYPLPAKERVKLEIRLDGYLPTFKTISAMGMQNLDLRLDPDPAKAAPPPPAPTVPATVRLTIESTPHGAMVYSKGAFLGKTPLELNRPRSDEALDLTLELAGHKSLNTTISQSSDTKAALVLEKLPAAAPKRTPRPPRPSAPKQDDPLDIAIGR